LTESAVIHKFGGSCLRDASDVDHIADVLNDSEGPPIVVVSALWGTTDRLMRAAKEPRYAGRLVDDLAKHHLRFSPQLVNSPLYDVFSKVLEGIETSLTLLAERHDDTSAYNQLLAAGERLSALVIAHALSERGFPAHPLGAEDIGLHLNGIGIAKTVDMERSAQHLDREAFEGVPVVTGWFGEGLDGSIALLGRGGSDHTATALAALLHAQKVILWKDVIGIHPINPRWGVPSTPISYLGYSEAIEFANTDANILHPATVEPVYALGIPIEIRHLSGYQKSGLRTVIGPDIEVHQTIKGIGCVPKVAYIEANVHYVQDAAITLSNIIATLDRDDIRICSFETQPSVWRFIVLQQDVHRTQTILSTVASNITTTYYAAMLSFIGSQDAEVLKTSMLKSGVWDNNPLHLTPFAAHMLTQRMDLSKMLESLMSALTVNRP